MSDTRFRYTISSLLAVSIAVLACLASCAKDEGTPPVVPVTIDTTDVAVFVDCASQHDNTFRLEQDNDVSTSGLLPGEQGLQWLKSLHHRVIRVWIQLRYVYNKGTVDYNYHYQGSDVPVEDALALYSQAADSLLVVLSAYNATSTWPLPARGEDFQRFVKETLVHYKTKFPRIKYIQVGSEPDYNGESVSEYYPVYQDYYRGINDANAKLGLSGSSRLVVSNGPFTSTSSFSKILDYSADFLAAYAADTDPGKKLDFFSFHCYTESDRPVMLLNDKRGIDSLMELAGLPHIPVFVTELGLVGGSFIPSVWNLGDAVIAQPAGQLTKALYLYKGGINEVFNWGIHHSSIIQKSELADPAAGYRYPYGNALSLCRELSERKTGLEASSKFIGSDGLGVHALASMETGKGIAVLVWNYNWTAAGKDKAVNVLVKAIPENAFPGHQIKRTIYLIDSGHNNYFTDQSQVSLKAAMEETIGYQAAVKTHLQLESNAIALILLASP